MTQCAHCSFSKNKSMNVDKATATKNGKKYTRYLLRTSERQTSHASCYYLTTNVSVDITDKDEVHSRYKDLAMVEEAFRTCNTGHLELRPIYVRKSGRTRAHVFVVMLSYLSVRELRIGMK